MPYTIYLLVAKLCRAFRRAQVDDLVQCSGRTASSFGQQAWSGRAGS